MVWRIIFLLGMMLPHHCPLSSSSLVAMSAHLKDGESCGDLNLDGDDPNTAGMVVRPPRAATKWRTAQALQPPLPQTTDHGEAEGAEWWLEQENLLQEAWKEWAVEMTLKLPPLNASLVDPVLRASIYRAWNHPSKKAEDEIRQLWDDVLPTGHVFAHGQLLTETGVEAIRTHLDAVAESGIPQRRPNAMNRYGVMLDPTVPGGMGATTPLMKFLEELVADFVRPLGRLFFPSYIHTEDDARFYAFSIRYRPFEDLELKEHSDAAVVSLNLNLNRPDEDFEGSSIYFVPPKEKKDVEPSFNTKQQPQAKEIDAVRHEMRFDPGTALLHRGMLRHGALPIENGQRLNLVIWLYGRDGSVRCAPYEEKEQLSIMQRWSRTSEST